MALSTLLEIVTRACDELGLPRPGVSGVVAASEPQTRQMLALLNAAGRDLTAAHEWSALISTASIAVSSASGSSYSLPTDFDRLVSDSFWDRTNNFPALGNISPQRHQFWLSSSVTAPTTRKEVRVTLNPGSATVYVHPTPTAAETLSFLYVRNTWASSDGSNVAEFAADTDTTVFKPQLLVKELKWRFRNAKGLDAMDAIAERNRLYDALVAADLGTGAVDMAGPSDMRPIDYLNIPDGNWNI